MNKLVPVITLCLMIVGANCLTCQEGLQQLLTGTMTPLGNNTLQGEQACPDDGQVYNCHRYDLVTTLTTGVTTELTLARCVPATPCPTLDCTSTSLSTIFGQGTAVTVNSCCYYCCSTDNCNNIPATPTTGLCNSNVGGGAPSFAHKLWIMVLTAILAVTTVSQFH